MRQRAVNVDLQPEIEEVCLDDLASFCFDKTGKGEEILCLQDKFDELVMIIILFPFRYLKYIFTCFKSLTLMYDIFF